MAALSTSVLPATTAPLGLGTVNASMRRKGASVTCVGGLSSFGGLKAQDEVVALGLPVCTNRQFSKVLNSLRSTAGAQGKRGKGGALASTCNAAAEIFRIAAIMNGLVLVGVAVGFVLLRIEASVEEAAES